jgi:hypothetical protein
MRQSSDGVAKPKLIPASDVDELEQLALRDEFCMIRMVDFDEAVEPWS